jgi:hypothetical protein
MSELDDVIPFGNQSVRDWMSSMRYPALVKRKRRVPKPADGMGSPAATDGEQVGLGVDWDQSRPVTGSTRPATAEPPPDDSVQPNFYL